MPRRNLDDIMVFLAVVDTGGFASGGKAMGLSRSAAGKAIARLEDRLGTRLLHRTTRKLSLTEEGRLFYHHGLRVLASLDEAEASVAGREGTPKGVLRLTVPDAFGRIVILPLIGKYLAAWPDIQVEVSFSDRLADIVEEGFDLAIRIGVTSPDTGLVTRVIARHKALLTAAPSYLDEREPPRDIEDLVTHDCLVFSSRNQRQGWRFHAPDGSGIKAPLRSRLRLDSGEAIRDAAIAGLGIAYLPDFLVADDLATGRLRHILPDLDSGDVNIVALYPDRRLLEPRVRRFIDLMTEALGG